MMSFSTSGGRREAADTKIDRCQHIAIPVTTGGLWQQRLVWRTADKDMRL